MLHSFSHRRPSKETIKYLYNIIPDPIACKERKHCGPSLHYRGSGFKFRFRFEVATDSLPLIHNQVLWGKGNRLCQQQVNYTAKRTHWNKHRLQLSPQDLWQFLIQWLRGRTVKKYRKRKWDSVYFPSETVNSCCCTEGCFMEQKHLDLCVVFPLIDCPGPRLLWVYWILSEHLLECWEDENYGFRRHTTAALQTQTEKNNCGSPHRGTNGDRKRRDTERRAAQTYCTVS